MSLEQVLFFSSLYSRASGGAPPSPLATDGLGAGRRAGRGHNWLPGTEPVPPVTSARTNSAGDSITHT